MKQYINTKLNDSAQLLYEMMELQDDIELELTDEIFISSFVDNPWILEVREGIDGNITKYDISNGIDKIIDDYGNLYIEDIR